MIMRVHIRSWAIKGKDAEIGGQVTLAPLLPNALSQKTPLMSADHNTPLIKISDGEDIKYKDDPAITQAEANLVAVEHI